MNKKLNESRLQKVVGNESTIRFPLGALEILNSTPAKQTASERLMLFTLIYCLRPLRYLEIGTFKGGSALLVAAAMDAADYPGKIICVDLRPQVDPENWKRIQHRATMVVGDSGKVLPEAHQVAGGPFDFIFIDGDHQEQAVIRDATEAAAVLAPGGYLLFHDSFCSGVKFGVDRFVLHSPGHWMDFGDVTREYTSVVQRDGKEEPFCGFRLVKHQTESLINWFGREFKEVAKLTPGKPVRLARRLARKAHLPKKPAGSRGSASS